MRMNICAAVLAFLVIFISIPAFAQSSLKIAVVDTDKAFKESIRGKKALEELERELELWQEKGEQLDKEITALEEQLATQRSFLEDKETEQKLRDDINRKQIEGQTLVQQGNAVLAEKRQQLLDPISDEIKDIIKKLAINEKYDLILEKQLFVLYLNPELDITSKIVVMLDTSYQEWASERAKEAEKPATEKTEEKKTE
ncbi:OmpH family outer membrane protein [Candidatus Poribacteria bacterium]